MIKSFKGISYCSPGHERDINIFSDKSLEGGDIVIIWTGHRVSTYFQGVLNKKAVPNNLVKARLLRFQSKFATGCIVYDECHTAMTDTFRESAASAFLIRMVRNVCFITKQRIHALINAYVQALPAYVDV